MAKLFTVAGVSRVRVGFPLKFRVANGKPAARARTLERAGCVDIQLFQIEPMNKMKALAWFELNHPELAAQIGNKQVKAVKAKAEKAPEVVEEPGVAPVAEEPAKVEVVDAALSAAAKLAVKRAKDAARKREKRAAERAAREAAKAAA